MTHQDDISMSSRASATQEGPDWRPGAADHAPFITGDRTEGHAGQERDRMEMTTYRPSVGEEAREGYLAERSGHPDLVDDGGLHWDDQETSRQDLRKQQEG